MTGIDEIVLSLSAKGLTTGEIAVLRGRVHSYGVEGPVSRITDKVLGEMAEWQNRPLGQIDGGWCRLGSNQSDGCLRASL